ncbi:hypothetical protein B0T11DRAFT_302575 [Plectosphaerella cucumerina]|uniref:Uncharacterized protein n=1 Tax=Plectosphaerella cucumerina TaxID=40658 RepID=A0A8K0T9X5_9PEZI|nr:hypothetical protein B0T11DRAFT_302575 [Plectosphaerella cucumerina]
MRFASLLFVSGLAAAAPAILDETNTVPQLLPSKPLMLGVDDVLLYGLNNTFKVIKQAEYLELMSSGEVMLRDEADLQTEGVEEASAIAARQTCNNRNVEFTVERTLDFSDWDVQMSPVLRGPGSLSISRGKSLANSIAVSASLGISWNVFSASLGVEYTRTWTSIDTTVILLTVPSGVWGTIVHNPWAHRKIGTAYTRCGNSAWTTSPFQATSYSNQQLGQMSWVQGAWSLCTSRSSASIPYCQGSGTHR